MHLIANLHDYVQENNYTHALRLRTGLIALFRPVEPGVNINADYRLSTWQVTYAWLNTLSLTHFTVLSPSFIHRLDGITLSLLAQAVDLRIQPDFLEEILTPHPSYSKM